MKQNIVVIDFEPPKSWSFISTLKYETGQEWVEKKCVSNQYRMGKIENFKRYLRYFSYSFKIFRERRRYGIIIGWQQFYGIIIGFFSRLFHVRKLNPLYVMTFIYKPKKGLTGKLYHSFIRFSINSKYIDKIICFSSTEPDYYSKLFNINNDKFVYVPLGEDLDIRNINAKKRHGIVSLGLSNRDYDFLIKVFKDLPYSLKIYADHDEQITSNINMSGEMLGDRVIDVLSNAELLVIPLQNRNISAGQLTALHAMQLGVPVIATDSDGIRDFIADGKNGYLADNIVAIWREKIDMLLSDKDIWNKMSKNTKEMYIKEHTVASMAKHIAEIVNAE